MVYYSCVSASIIDVSISWHEIYVKKVFYFSYGECFSAKVEQFEIRDRNVIEEGKKEKIVLKALFAIEMGLKSSIKSALKVQKNSPKRFF